MTITEFPVNLDVEGKPGSLFISDASLLVRPRTVPGQYPASVKHDTIHASQVMNLGNDRGKYQWHIIYKGDPRAAHELLDRVFYAYVDGCCLELWCDARACYIVDGATVYVRKYGFDDGQYTMVFNVYCDIAKDQTEKFLATLAANETDRFIVVRPDLSERGFSVHGFDVDSSEKDDFDGAEDEYDECPRGCGQPAYACTCAELASFRHYNAIPLEERCGPWTA